MERIKLKKVFNILCLFPILFFLSCNSESDKIDIRDYYFPLKALTEGQVYEYQPIDNDTLGPNYWYYRSFLSKEEKFLTGTYYERDLIPQQFVREEMIHNGMLLEEIKLAVADTSGKSEMESAEIVSGSVFPFEVRDSGGIFLYKISWSVPVDPPMQTTLIKNRRYIGKDTYTYKDKTYDCVVFDVKELFEVDQEGYFEQEYSGIEYYAKGLGLIYYKKKISEEFALEYQLADTYPMEVLEERFKKMQTELEPSKD